MPIMEWAIFAAYRAMQLAIDKAKSVGIACVVVGHSNHFGIAGYYSLMAVEKGMIGMCGTNARPAISPTWGVEQCWGQSFYYRYAYRLGVSMVCGSSDIHNTTG